MNVPQYNSKYMVSNYQKKKKKLSSNIYIENSIKNTKTLGRTTNFYSCETIKVHISHHLYTCTVHNFCNLQYKFINDHSQFNKGKLRTPCHHTCKIASNELYIWLKHPKNIAICCKICSVNPTDEKRAIHYTK